MFSAAQVYPVIFYIAYLSIAIMWLTFVWSFGISIFIGSLFLLVSMGIVFKCIAKRYYTLTKTNEILVSEINSLRHKSEKAMLSQQVIEEGTKSLNQQNAYLTTLHATALALMHGLDLEDILENIVRHVVELAGTADAFISLADTENSLVTKAGTGRYTESIGSSVRDDKIACEVYKTGHSIILNHAQKKFESEYIYPEFKTFAAIPLRYGEETFGMIGFGYYNETSLSQVELEFFEGFAALAASAVHNAKVYEKVRHELSERALIEEKLKYISIHDSLTGLYNRIYFEEEMRRLRSGRFDPVGIIICDVDGLKLVNDSLGHIPGDELLQAAAMVIKQCFRDNDVIARIGGDEFAILLPNTNLSFVEAAYQRIMKAVVEYNANSSGFLLSISVGFACKTSDDTDVQEVFQLADDSMYRKKMQNRQQSREALVQSIRERLDAKNLLVGEHSERLYQLVLALAKEVGLNSNKNITDLSLLVEFHDIGKIGIPDGILTKATPLTNGEFNEIRRHSEIGYRIAKVLPELAPIADCILKHHEWWNGEGYPFGIVGKEIPLECRIWAIADAYDAMISSRPYREALTCQAAISELKKCAGTQFDPELVEVFIKMIEEQKTRQA